MKRRNENINFPENVGPFFKKNLKSYDELSIILYNPGLQKRHKFIILLSMNDV